MLKGKSRGSDCLPNLISGSLQAMHPKRGHTFLNLLKAIALTPSAPAQNVGTDFSQNAEGGEPWFSALILLNWFNSSSERKRVWSRWSRNTSRSIQGKWWGRITSTGAHQINHFVRFLYLSPSHSISLSLSDTNRYEHPPLPPPSPPKKLLDPENKGYIEVDVMK